MQKRYMKRKLYSILVLVAILLLGQSCRDNLYDVQYEPNPEDVDGDIVPTNFTRGVNLAGCFDVGDQSDATNIWHVHTNAESFANLRSLGCDVARVPMNLDRFVKKGAENYELQDEFWAKLDDLLDNGENNGITVIIDNHAWNLTSKYPEDHAEGFMKSVWRQIASHCKNRSEKVVYELKNEPDGTWWREHWPELQGELIKVIREIDPNHAIIVAPAPYHYLSELPEYEDDNLIYTTHFYAPFIFTHQGAGWNGLGKMGGKVTFPYDSSKPIDPSLVTRDEYKAQIASYVYDGTESAVIAALDKEINMIKRRNAKLFVGEFGTLGFTGMSNEERCLWHRIVREHLEKNDVSWTVWSYATSFGIFNTENANMKFNRDLNLDMVKALGLTVPSGYGEEDETGYETLMIYDDNWGSKITPIIPAPGHWDHLTIPWKEKPATGTNCIKWSVAGAWSYCVFSFKDACENLSKFDVEKTTLRFKFRAKMDDAEKLNFGIWFVNNKEKFTKEEDKHNWVKQYGFTKNNALPDGEWHDVRIPLSEFTCRMAEDANIESEGHFTWQKMKEIQFSTFFSETCAGVDFYLDDVRIVGPTVEGPIDPEPEPNAFNIWTDQADNNMVAENVGNGVEVVTTDPAKGTSCLKWTFLNTGQWCAYNCFVFPNQNADLSEYKLDETSLDFYLKVENDAGGGWELFTILFNSSNSGGKAERQIWRAGSYPNEDPFIYSADKTWHKVSIPLKDFSTTDDFDWSKVKQISFTNDKYAATAGTVIYLDEVKLVGPKKDPVEPGPAGSTFNIWTDQADNNVNAENVDGNGVVAVSDDPAVGSSCLKWTFLNTGQWSAYNCFVFPNKNKDMSSYNLEKTTLDFYLKVEADTEPGSWELFTILFLSSKNDSWMAERIVYRSTTYSGSDNLKFSADKTWHKVSIPLSEFSKEGNFDWAEVKQISFTNHKYHATAGTIIYLDDIKLVEKE